MVVVLWCVITRSELRNGGSGGGGGVGVGGQGWGAAAVGRGDHGLLETREGGVLVSLRS